VQSSSSTPGCFFYLPDEYNMCEWLWELGSIEHDTDMHSLKSGDSYVLVQFLGACAAETAVVPL
jgi:hypothetical protein